MVDWDGLENRSLLTGTEGSNPSLSSATKRALEGALFVAEDESGRGENPFFLPFFVSHQVHWKKCGKPLLSSINAYIIDMLHIGLTGRIGSGKSTLGRMLRDKGYCVLDADVEVHSLYQFHAALREDLSRALGSDVLTEKGVNRSVLASRVFSDTNALHTLESLVFPVLSEYLQSRITKMEKESSHFQAIFVEGALLFKIPVFSRSLDQIWVVDAPENLRLARLIQRGLSREDALNRIDLQRHNPLPPSDHYVYFDNSGSLESLAKQLPF